MKKIIFAFLIFCFQLSIITDANAAPVRNMPVKRLQPNGDTLNCFISGDEYYHRLHDANGYTIVQSPSTGWYVYADRQWDDSHRDWEVVATNHIVGTVEPSTHHCCSQIQEMGNSNTIPSQCPSQRQLLVFESHIQP